MTCDTQALHRAEAHVGSHGLTALLKGWWDAYWARKAKRATVLMLHALDDRALADIGLHRSEIESIVYGKSDQRLHLYREW